MSVFSSRSFKEHENIVFCHDHVTGLKAIIAVHNTNRGPALGGCRMWPYESEEEALEDVLRLSRGMTYKSALANLKLGGGKAVIIGDPKTQKTPELLEAMAGFVDRLGGTYITAEDSGTSLADMNHILNFTKHVVGTDKGGSGDPSPATGYGTFIGLKACIKYLHGHDALAGVKVAIQGLGHAGGHLCRHLVEAGAEVVATDISDTKLQKAVDEWGIKAVGVNEIYNQDVDVFAPCALGAILNDDTIPVIKAKIIAGCANNQLARSRHGEDLLERGILYAPDYAINAGGVINVSYEADPKGYSKEKSYAHIDTIQDTLLEIFESAKQGRIPTSIAADRVAEKRFMKNGGDNGNNVVNM